MERLHFEHITYNDYVWIYAGAYGHIWSKVTGRMTTIQGCVDRLSYYGFVLE
jgi:hypothetical protein